MQPLAPKQSVSAPGWKVTLNPPSKMSIKKIFILGTQRFLSLFWSRCIKYSKNNLIVPKNYDECESILFHQIESPKHGFKKEYDTLWY